MSADGASLTRLCDMNLASLFPFSLLLGLDASFSSLVQPLRMQLQRPKQTEALLGNMDNSNPSLENMRCQKILGMTI